MKPWEIEQIKARVKPWVLDGYLTDYQKEAWHWSATREGSLLWWACGAGKTLAAILWLLNGTRQERKLIVTRAPAKQQWRFQIAQYTDLEATVLSGFTARMLLDEECIIISWEMLPYWRQAIEQWAQGGTLSIVWDEIHKGKSWRRKERYVTGLGTTGWRYMDNRVAAAAQLARKATRRIGLTATPIQDRRMDLWGQLDLVEPGKHKTSFHWAKRYCAATQGAYGGLDTTGKSNCEELKQTLAKLTHRVPYAEMAKALPPKRRQLIRIGRDEQSKTPGFVTELRNAAAKGKQHLFEARLQQCAAAKRSWITETVYDLASAGQKVTVFTGRRKDCEKLASAIRKKLKKNKDVTVWSGHGGDSLTARQQMVHEYANCDKGGVFVGTTDAFGEAIDGLQNTDTAIFALLPWTPGLVTQAEGRFSRHGSTRPVLISYIIAEGTVDEHVADVLLSKLEMVQHTLDDEEAGGVASTLAGFDNEDEILDELFTLMREDDAQI